MDDNEISCEPMDVDLSYNSINAMDISYTDYTDTFDYSNVIIKKEKNVDYSVKDLCRSPSPVPITDVKSGTVLGNRYQMRTVNNGILISCLGFLLLSILMYQLSQFKCCEDYHLTSIKASLQSRLHGQSATIDALIRALEHNVSKIIILYGGTGVGKTLTTSLILENKLNYSNIYHYTMPSFLQIFSTELMIGHTICKSSMVVLDDLQSYDIVSVEEPLQELVDKTNKLSKIITIILVYNCHDINGIFIHKCDNFLNKLKNNLNDINTAKYYIKFSPLNEEHLKKCIINELQDKIVSDNELDKIVKNFNVTLDGCKGVHQKMKYLNIV